MKLKSIINIVWIILIFSQNSLGNTEFDKTRSIFDELSFQETVEIDLELNMDEVFTNRRNGDKHLAKFSFEDKNGNLQEWNIKVALRGKFRRTRCENMPPLKLNFKKKELAAAGLAKFDDMKLVTHCVDNKKEAKQLLAKEYLAYKLYNQLTVESFRAQFVKINYKDVKTGKVEKQYGIIIEDTAQMRNRMGGKKVKPLYNLPKDAYHPKQLKMVSLFQYMIGNSDWDLNRLHNVKVVDREGGKVAIPYDFDFSGIVGAPYVSVNPELGLTSHKDRIFLGFREDVNDLDETIALFSSKKEDLLKTIKDCKLLSNKSRRESLKYIESFYNELENIRLPKETVAISSTLGE